MEKKFEELVSQLDISPLSVDILQQISLILKKQDNASLCSFVHKSFDSLLVVEQWMWKVLSDDYCDEWINEEHYQEFFYTVASFNKDLIFNSGDIKVDTKGSLLFCVSIDQINKIFTKLDRSNDDNNPFINIISLWLDNYSYFLNDNPQYNITPVIDYIGRHITVKYFMSKQYKLYLTELRQPYLIQSIFTVKFLFYIKTCSFYLYTYLYTSLKSSNFLYTADEMISYLYEDYLEIIHVHSYNVMSWDKELLGCIAQLVGLIGGCCWWDGQHRPQLKILFPKKQIACDHVEDLTRIIAHTQFYKQTKSVRSNDETILMDTTFMILLIIVQTQNINWLFRSNTTIRDTIISVAEAALNDEVCLCGYCILGEALGDDLLKDLKIADNISDYFFHLLQEAWNNLSNKYKQIPIEILLRAFQTLSKNDSIQQRTASSNKIPHFIEMSDQYPIVYDIIWALSFNHDIQQQLRSNSLFMSKLSHLAQQGGNEQMRKITHGILWNLEINHQDRSISQSTKQNTFDIMISYSHKEKVLCKQLYDELTKNGYRVWIDFDQMHGNVMDAMAQAIDRSEIIIICMSEQYRQSNFCRAEAHYAFQRQRQIVPVLMQKHYKPDGWLLFLIGQLLYVDFTKYEFVRAMEMLSKELKAIHIPDINRTPVQPKQDIHVAPSKVTITSPKISSSNIIEWTSTQVHDWLLEHNLVRMSRLLNDCDGRSLVYLHKCMDISQPEQMLSLLQEDSLRLINQNISLIELSRFHSMIHQEKRLI
ncbi:unnamed protein product [Adineta steineri]|uniref:TIR domain-containing protein n=1 Tax=Adineta steineri TaxID=433720 RepID=A0A815DKC0_9BILA|nr:unnamed protein product [Adineta steineri]CAF3998652.1 unnamed protein product [Adineta steineri]